MTSAHAVSSPQAEVELDLTAIAAQLDSLRADLVAQTERRRADIDAVHPSNRASAINLIQYRAFRDHDLRSLQAALRHHGLSSLGRSEAHVLAAIDGVRIAVAALLGRPEPANGGPGPSVAGGDEILDANTVTLFGPRVGERTTRIMVTMPSTAADDPDLVGDLMGAGTSNFRINCAHDGSGEWGQMVAHIRSAESEQKRRAIVAMDLAGPKLRTGALADGPQVVKIKPERDAFGRTTVPAAVRLTPATQAPSADGLPPGTLPITDAAWLDGAAVGDTISVTDTRGAHREMVVTGRDGDDVLCDLPDTTYFAPGTVLDRQGHTVEVGMLPPLRQRVRLHVGDHLIVTPDTTPQPAQAIPPRIGCTLPKVFTDARAGERIYFDDGRIGGVIESIDDEGLHVLITDCSVGGDWLGAEKGINLPDTTLNLPALTDDDLEVLPFVVEHADVVNLSFVRMAADVAHLQAELARLGRPDMPIVLKVETVEGFRNLSAILLQAMHSPSVGVLIARGDLAVEAGYVRMGEVQEEIMWLCEAGHVPVVWATQVLDSLAKKGRPSRAEVTDAAMSGRAECVMLNKGPHIVDAVRFLDDLLSRMEEHQNKKSSLLRRLRFGSGSVV
ncbi:pyruvate kinase [Kribbia dieselivorans]|uniref:pyruvate kinase n=1 Tax=Kribbia dieselivorans TaxID=331526 RepID=UPI000A4935B7|nr:pyruvate kinase [Kribbia dieselivorans]